MSAHSDRGYTHMHTHTSLKLPPTVICPHLLELVERLLGVDLAPVDAARVDLVHDAQEDEAISEVLEEVVDERIDAQRVDPQREGARLAGALRGEEPLLELAALLFGQRLETRVRVEEVGHESEVQLRVAGHDITRLQELSAVELGRVLQNHLGALVQVWLLERVLVALILHVPVRHPH